jgi:S1-C subfamily serine protease
MADIPADFSRKMEKSLLRSVSSKIVLLFALVYAGAVFAGSASASTTKNDLEKGWGACDQANYAAAQYHAGLAHVDEKIRFVHTYASLEQSQPMLEVTTSFGTGWPIRSGYVITNNHVVADREDIRVVTADGEEMPAHIALRDEENDLALLEVEDFSRLPAALPLSDSIIRMGASVFTVGFPRVDIMGRTPKLATGVISCVNGLDDDPSTYQISVPILSGNSGGPIFNNKGEVVGVVKSMLAVYNSASGGTRMLPGFNYAVKIGVLKELLTKAPYKGSLLKELSSVPGGLEELVARVTDSVLIVFARQQLVATGQSP